MPYLNFLHGECSRGDDEVLDASLERGNFGGADEEEVRGELDSLSLEDDSLDCAIDEELEAELGGACVRVNNLFENYADVVLFEVLELGLRVEELGEGVFHLVGEFELHVLRDGQLDVFLTVGPGHQDIRGGNILSRFRVTGFLLATLVRDELLILVEGDEKAGCKSLEIRCSEINKSVRKLEDVQKKNC